MNSPVREKSESDLHSHTRDRSSDGTVVDEFPKYPHDDQSRHQDTSRAHLPNLTINDLQNEEHNDMLRSPSQSREQAHRLDDDLRLLQVERQVSRIAEETEEELKNARSRSRVRIEEPIDDFDVATNPLHETAQVYKPPENPSTKLAAFFLKVHHSTFLVRYVVYISPVVLVLLIPLLLGALVYHNNASVGGVYLLWFCIWLEIVWLTLWAGRLLAKCLPYTMA
ncbi:hypothetical protein MRB53_038276 [Persea americana]|nr:hypothetical protein MRB53_038276 [Persea americana]